MEINIVQFLLKTGREKEKESWERNILPKKGSFMELLVMESWT